MMGGRELRRENETMSAEDRDRMTAGTDHARSVSASGAESLHGDMSTPMEAGSGQGVPDTTAAEGSERTRTGRDAGEAGALNAPDDDTLGTLTTGGTGGTTGVSGTAEGTFEGAGHSYGDPDTLRDDNRPGR